MVQGSSGGNGKMRIAAKEEVVARLSQRLAGAKCVYLTDFTGLNVASMTELRRRLAEAQVDYVVVKNTLARRALSDGAYESLIAHLEGANAFAVSRADIVVAAKILTDFAKERERPKIKAGVIEGQVVSIDDIRRIAGLPPREVLLAQLMGSAQAPIAGVVTILSGLLSKFVRTVDALRAQKAAEQPSPEAEPAVQAEA
jgi:large subunit ribosomal protein L10